MRAFRARSSKRGAMRHLGEDSGWYLVEPQVESKKTSFSEQEIYLGKSLISLSHSLQEYKIIDTDLSKKQLSSSFIQGSFTYFSVRFTMYGYKLAEEYTHVWHWIRLWYNRFIRHHPIIIIIAFFLGILSNEVGRLFLDWIRN